MNSQQLPTLCPPATQLPEVSIKEKPEDFIVEELALYEPSGSGTHAYFWIEKQNLNTHDAARRLAALLKKRSPDAGIAGLKDARAISRQWISFEHVGTEELSAASALSDANLRVLKVSSHKNKLKMGHLRGNRFLIRLRLHEDTRANRDLLLSRSRECLKSLLQKGIPNYFGEQRFGRQGDNATLGRMLVLGDVKGFEEAFARAQGSRRPDSKLRNLLVNAFQSELFNIVLALRMPEIGLLQAGDLAHLHRNGAVFSVASEVDASREQARADSMEISPSGPIYGEKSLLASGKPGDVERDVLGQAGVSLADFGRREAERQPGARRSLRIAFLEEPVVEDDAAGVLLRFALPSGAYATVVLNEILGEGVATD